jgi:hypothetical protein
LDYFSFSQGNILSDAKWFGWHIRFKCPFQQYLSDMIDNHGPEYVVGWSTEIFLECSIVKSTVVVVLPFVTVKYELYRN